jgi:hypothetical protein
MIYSWTRRWNDTTVVRGVPVRINRELHRERYTHPSQWLAHEELLGATRIIRGIFANSLKLDVKHKKLPYATKWYGRNLNEPSNKERAARKSRFQRLLRSIHC